MNYLLTNQQTQRLKFRTLDESDFDTWLEFFKNKQCIINVGMNPDLTPQELCKIWFKKSLGRYENNTGGMNVMINKQNNDFIGLCGLLVQNVEGVECLEVGYSILPKHWGQGYASEASQKCRDYAFENNLVESLISMVIEGNIGSEKVARKNGMRLEKPLDDYEGLKVNVFKIEKDDWLKLNG